MKCGMITLKFIKFIELGDFELIGDEIHKPIKLIFEFNNGWLNQKFYLENGGIANVNNFEINENFVLAIEDTIFKDYTTLAEAWSEFVYNCQWYGINWSLENVKYNGTLCSFISELSEILDIFTGAENLFNFSEFYSNNPNDYLFSAHYYDANLGDITYGEHLEWENIKDFIYNRNDIINIEEK